MVGPWLRAAGHGWMDAQRPDQGIGSSALWPPCHDHASKSTDASLVSSLGPNDEACLPALPASPAFRPSCMDQRAGTHAPPVAAAAVLFVSVVRQRRHAMPSPSRPCSTEQRHNRRSTAPPVAHAAPGSAAPSFSSNDNSLFGTVTQRGHCQRAKRKASDGLAAGEAVLSSLLRARASARYSSRPLPVPSHPIPSRPQSQQIPVPVPPFAPDRPRPTAGAIGQVSREREGMVAEVRLKSPKSWSD